MTYKPEDLCNQALDAIGSLVFIGDLQEGSRVSQVCLRHYGPILTRLLRDQNWDFAERTVALSLLKSAPPGGYSISTPWSSTYPLPPWLYEYSYPTDCLKIRCIKQVPNVDLSPVPHVYQIANDTNKVILANISNAILVYTGLVTDTTQWNPVFIDMFIVRMAQRLAYAFEKVGQGKGPDDKETGDEKGGHQDNERTQPDAARPGAIAMTQG